ncbi:integrin beta-like protein 1 [Pectinophora gossypiella]|uniref:integrin beta-like protein 1 n=1 Tax=Pectinophora gossypiella TaxID=13191 RepID=UPI00214E1C8F|nr:integrin beta-like protein 1 [Pectinophora gossypiella]
MKNFVIVTLVVLAVTVYGRRRPFVMDEQWVCGIKKSCVDCLRLPHCSWCEAESTCFSKNLPLFEDFCADNAMHYVDHGLNLEDNAKCTCSSSEIENNCYQPGVYDGAECSNRGTCQCGRCVCDSPADPDHPTKTIVGEYCEFDNFSCDGPRCNEGPYYIHQTYDDDME